MKIVGIWMKGKSGWIRILEATIAVMIVSVTMISVYSGQSVREDLTVADYSYSLQNQILADVALRSDLRLDALNVVEDLPGDVAYDRLNAFVGESIPESFGYLLRVCKLGDVLDFCKMDTRTFIISMNEDVFVEDVVISAEIGNGSGVEIYSPKKVRLFFWEGGFPEDFCRDECLEAGQVLSCSADFADVLTRDCGNFDDDECLEYINPVLDPCVAGEVCEDGACVVGPSGGYSIWTCSGTTTKSGSDVCYDDECYGWDSGSSWGCGLFGCGCDYLCSSYVTETTECLENPVCSGGLSFVSSESCEAPCEGTCSMGDDSILSCSGDFVMKSDCEDSGDGCWDYGVAVEDVNCGDVGEVCEDGACVGGVASLSLGFSNINYVWTAPNHYYYHDRTFVESGGVGVTLTWGELCSLQSGCNSAVINRRVDANGQYSWSDNFYTNLNSEEFTLTYTGVDDNGNLISVQGIVEVSGSSWISP